MNEAQAVAAIHAFFAAGWNGLTPVLHDDERKAIPEETWVRLNVRNNVGNQRTMGDPGNNRHEQEGGITVQVFQPEGQVAKDALEKATAAAAVFRGKSAGLIHFYETSVRPGRSDGRGFYQINVDVRFRYSIYA